MSGQHWNVEEPCTYCGATSNTSHFKACRNFGLYDADGVAIPAVPRDTPPAAGRCKASDTDAGDPGLVDGWPGSSAYVGPRVVRRDVGHGSEVAG